MDPLTHVLLGAVAGQSLARESTRTAALAGALSALLPDIDVLFGSSSDPLSTLEYHRHFTHALVVAPLGAALTALVVFFVLRQRVSFLALFVPSLAGYVSAILLDACTSYGTMLLWPFSDRRIAASVIAVIDPVLTVVLVIGAIAALRSAAARPARIALACALAYLSFGWIQRERAEALIEREAKARGHVIAEHEVKPTLGNLLLWRSVYLSGNDYMVDAARVALSSIVYPGAAVRRVKPIDFVPPLTLNSVQAEDLVRFARVSNGYLARYPGRPNVIGDVRYSILPDDIRPLWAIEIMPEREDQHVNFHTFRSYTRQDRERFFAMLRGVKPASLAPAPGAGPQQAPAAARAHRRPSAR